MNATARWILIGIGAYCLASYMSTPSLTGTDNAKPDKVLLDLDGVNGLPGYDTMDEAGMAAIERAYRCSHYYECGGVIAQRESDGKYVVGPAVSSYGGDHVRVTHGSPSGTTVVADYHTHPCLPDSHFVSYFSPDDVAETTTLHITGYMGDLCSGDVHKYNYATMDPAPEKVADGLDTVYLTHGVIIGSIKVDHVSVEPHTGMN